MTLATLALAGLVGSAHAQGVDSKLNGHEISLELGTFGAPDPSWEIIGDGSPVGSYGGRVGYGLTKTLSIVAGYHHSYDGSQVEGEVDDDWDELFSTSFRSHQITLGPKVRWNIKPWVAPYATVQGIGWIGRARIDDDTESDDNPNQYAYSGFAPGVLGAGGIELRPVKVTKGLRLATHLELGYGHTAQMTLTQDGGTDPANDDGDNAAELGRVGFRGFTLRWGVGVRF